MLTLLEHFGYHTALLEDSFSFLKFQFIHPPTKRKDAITLIAHISAPSMPLLVWKVDPQCGLIGAMNTTDSSCTPGKQWLTGS